MPTPDAPKHVDHSAELREKMTAMLAKLTVRRGAAIAHHGAIQGEAARRAENLRREQLAIHEQLHAEGEATSDDGDVLERTAFGRRMYEQIAGGAAPGSKPARGV